MLSNLRCKVRHCHLDKLKPCLWDATTARAPLCLASFTSSTLPMSLHLLLLVLNLTEVIFLSSWPPLLLILPRTQCYVDKLKLCLWDASTAPRVPLCLASSNLPMLFHLLLRVLNLTGLIFLSSWLLPRNCSSSCAESLATARPAWHSRSVRAKYAHQLRKWGVSSRTPCSQSCKNVPTVPTSWCKFFLDGANFWEKHTKNCAIMSISYHLSL